MIYIPIQLCFFFNHRGTQRRTEDFFNTEEKPENPETTEIWENVHFCPSVESTPKSPCRWVFCHSERSEESIIV